MYHALKKIDTCSIAITLSSQWTDAIRWVAPAYKKFLQKLFKLVFWVQIWWCFIEYEENPFADLEDHNESTNSDEDPDALESQYLMDQHQTEDLCSVEEFIQADSELPTCQDILEIIGKILLFKWLVQVLKHSA